MNAVRKTASIAVGFVFFISGILKLMDPVGAGLVMESYFRFLHLLFLLPGAKLAALLFAYAETLVGAALMTMVWRKTVAWVSAAFLLFFTLLTLVLLIVNPAMDCGCFGEALHLSHGQTFLKNIVLCLLWCAAFLPFRNPEPMRSLQKVGFLVSAVSVLLFAGYSTVSVPLVDYTPFAPGVELGADSEYIAEPLSFYDSDGEYCDSLSREGDVLIVSVYNPQSAPWEKISAFLSDSTATGGYATLLLAACAPEDLAEYGLQESVAEKCRFADRKTLMTFNRSNGGVTCVRDAVIVSKWAARRYPDSAKLAELSAVPSVEAAIKESTAGKYRLQGFLLYSFAVMLLL